MRGEFPSIVASIAESVIDSFAQRDTAELVTDFTYVYPLRVFTEILGLPPENVKTSTTRPSISRGSPRIPDAGSRP